MREGKRPAEGGEKGHHQGGRPPTKSLPRHVGVVPHLDGDSHDGKAHGHDVAWGGAVVPGAHVALESLE